MRKPVYAGICSYTKNLSRYRFFSDIIQGKIFSHEIASSTAENSAMFFAFCIRIDEGSGNMSEKACTKGKRKSHSCSKQIITLLKALPYGLSTQALLRPQVRPCCSRSSSAWSAAGAVPQQCSHNYFQSATAPDQGMHKTEPRAGL